MEEVPCFALDLTCGGITVGSGGGWAGSGRGSVGAGVPTHAAPSVLQIWQGIDIETKMHVRFLNMETIALCH